MSYARSLRSLGFARFRLEAASAEPSSATATTAEAATASTKASASTETATAAAVENRVDHHAGDNRTGGSATGIVAIVVGGDVVLC